MKAFAFVIAAVVALTLSACFPPYTTHPLGTTIGLSNDPLLAGTWRADPPSGDTSGKFQYYHFLPAKNGTILAVAVPSVGESSDLLLVRLTTARVGAVGIMNARLMPGPDSDASGQAPGTIPVLYRQDAQGRLLLFTPNEDAVRDAIKAGTIGGTVGKDGAGDAVVTSDGPALDKYFLSKTGLALFTDLQLTLTKVN